MSKANDVADAIQAAMVALMPTAMHAKRKKPSLPPGKELTTGQKAVVVSVGEEGAIERITATKVLVKYPAAVTLITGGGFNAGDDETVHDLREDIRKALFDYGNYATVVGFNDVSIFSGTPFDTRALDAALNYAIQTATVEVLESRL